MPIAGGSRRSIQALFMDSTVAVSDWPGVHIVTCKRTIVAFVFLLAAGIGVLLAPASSTAQGSCRSTCWESYGSCYKATNSRQRCQSHLQRCLNGCIRSKRR